MTAPIWLHAAWVWLKKYWQWLLFPIGILLYVIGRASAKTDVTVVSPGLVEHSAVKAQLDAEAETKKQEASVVAERQLAEIEAQRTVIADAETKKQIAEIDAAQGDPKAVSDLLKGIGNDIRGRR